jgi:hypothetical protein
MKHAVRTPDTLLANDSGAKGEYIGSHLKGKTEIPA